MDVFIALVIIVFVIALIVKLVSGATKPHLEYEYTAKTHIMTETEEKFFRLLNDTVSEKYFVFPQIHLSAVLDHVSSGQDSLYAFRHINQKSVDYVLCDKNNLRPVYAIELDDYTHRVNKHRYDRDVEVDRIFRDANMPLVRFKNINSLSKEVIINKLTEARQARAANQQLPPK